MVGDDATMTTMDANDRRDETRTSTAAIAREMLTTSLLSPFALPLAEYFGR